MENEYAFAKLQSLSQEEFFIRQIPLILRRKVERETTKNASILAKESPASLGIEKCIDIRKKKCFALVALAPIVVDGKSAVILQEASLLLKEISRPDSLRLLDKYEEYSTPLKNFSQIYIPCTKCEIPHIYVVVLPAAEVQKNESLNLKASSVFSHAQNQANPNNKIHDKALYQKWSSDDREQLKKFVVNYGYGRWKQIQRSSFAIGGKLGDRPKSEIRAFANAFIRALAEQLNAQNADLKQFLYNMVDEYPDDSYITPSDKDWDAVILHQRTIPYTKRLQLLYRIRVLIKKFKDDSLKGMTDRQKDKINWEGLLNFLPNSLLYGQRPSVWWTKKHDTDLLRGVYKYGYANYQTIRHAAEYCFSELEKIANVYQNFPSSDALTRRLKKLISTILKSEEDKGKIDFDISASSDDEERGWSVEEKEILFNYLKDNGVPLNNDGRQNWVEIRDRMKLAYQLKKESTIQSQIDEETQEPKEQSQITQELQSQQQQQLTQPQQEQQKEQQVDASSPSKDGVDQADKKNETNIPAGSDIPNIAPTDESREFDKSTWQIEKMVQRIRVKCQELIAQNQTLEGKKKLHKSDIIDPSETPQSHALMEDEEGEDKDADGFTITLQLAKIFNRKTNMLHFIRKTVISNNSALFNSSTEDLIKKHEAIGHSHPAYIADSAYDPAVHDLNLMMLVSTNGFSSLGEVHKYPSYELAQFDLPESKWFSRLEWLCECFKEIKDNSLNKKRKVEKVSFRDTLNKKSKFELVRDSEGNIVFPIQINPSFKLLATGEINTLPAYHSEHNLFPVGFKSVRLHASIFNKGVRCEYTNEVLEGPDSRPLYRVTSAEDPQHPIVKESSTGCWVYICQRVNDLQDVKKEKVTISGTERYGFLETNVIRLLEDLPNAELCTRYKFKFKNVPRSQEELE